MGSSLFRHHNNCPRCPVIGAENISGTDYYQVLSLRFNLRIARLLCRDRMSLSVDRAGLERWLEHAHIDWEHVDHLPLNLGPGMMVTLPSGCGMPLIDGNHRAARALRDRKDFFALLLNEAETLELLRRSIGAGVADHYWRRMADSKPHPDDVPQGENVGRQNR